MYLRIALLDKLFSELSLEMQENNGKHYVDHITCNIFGGVLIGKPCKTLCGSYHL